MSTTMTATGRRGTDVLAEARAELDKQLRRQRGLPEVESTPKVSESEPLTDDDEFWFQREKKQEQSRRHKDAMRALREHKAITKARRAYWAKGLVCPPGLADQVRADLAKKYAPVEEVETDDDFPAGIQWTDNCEPVDRETVRAAYELGQRCELTADAMEAVY